MANYRVPLLVFLLATALIGLAAAQQPPAPAAENPNPVRAIRSDKDGMLRETVVREGFFVPTAMSQVRDYKAGGGQSKILPLPVVHIDPDSPQQSILGFGGAFTDASCYMISTLSPNDRAQLLDTLFSPTKFNFNVGRCTVGQCDFGRVCYSYDDTPDDTGLKNFSIDYDKAYIIPTIKAARAINPDLFLLSSPWSPPGWMKTGGVMTGGWMREKYLDTYADYYVRYLMAYADAGIPINALTTQNEPETDQLSLMPACYWHPDFESEFIRDHLVPKLQKNKLNVQIWLLDHNYIMWRRAKYQLDDPTLKKLVTGVAFHPYEGNSDDMTLVQTAHPDIDLHVTEVGGGRIQERTSEAIAESACAVSQKFTDMLQHQTRSIFCWNIALDENGHPNIGPFFGGAGMVQITSDTHAVAYNPQLYALAHYSSYVRRGARRLPSAGAFDGLSHVAFKNPDGAYVVILTNTGPATEVSLDLKTRYATLPITEKSVTTVIFK